LLVICFISINTIFARERLVQIATEIVEINLTKSQEYGISWTDLLHTQEKSIPGIFGINDFARLDKLTADLKLLMDKGAAELLANPKLVTRSGTTASFKVGGEIPYIVTGGYGTVNVEFKPYGVSLEIKPVIQTDENIDLTLKTEVSTPHEITGVYLSGNAVPAILSRVLNSQLSIKPGTTVTIAGLNQTRKETIKRGVPLLSEIPLLGALFSWNKVTNNKTSVVIFVTPTILEQK